DVCSSDLNRSTTARPTPCVAPVTTTTSGLPIVLALLGSGDRNRVRRVDQRQMRQRLRQVAQQLVRLGIDLIRVQARVVREREQLLHALARLVEAAAARERLDEPERAREKRALDPLLA